ncbi:MAG: S8 family serine peptidase [Actinobacteria bacterium]|nr:S8 family serine peptidase [Actinomycetota bacterium]
MRSAIPARGAVAALRPPGIAMLVAAVGASGALAAAAPVAGDTTDRRVIIAGVEGAGAEIGALVASVGGEVVGELPIIDGVVAEVSTAVVDTLRGSALVRSLTDDAPVASHSDTTTTTAPPVYEGFDAAANPGSLALLNRDVIGAGAYWDAGYTGAGVDVAIIDTGTATVAGLDAGQVLHGPDLSFDSQIPAWTNTDGYGHGTHIGAIIAGREARHTGAPVSTDTTNFLGVAPGARLVSVKIGDHGGAADVSQAIAAIDWVATNRDQHGLDIRVLNLSFGYDSSQAYTTDPLAYAAEQAWRTGIVVVAAAGNGGPRTRLSSPAYNPHIIAVGATDSMMTATTDDDVIPSWSSCDSIRNPDVVAPGRSIVSLRAPGSYVDVNFPSSKVTEHLTRGSGTSQSAGFVSGAAALIVSQRPSITPDGVRSLLTETAGSIQKSAPKKCQGAGVIDLAKALVTETPAAALPSSALAPSAGTGSLEAARGGIHITDLALAEDDAHRVLSGEQDIFGRAWTGSTWAAAIATGTSWSPDGWWNGNQWSGDQWSGNQWSGNQWSATSWSGNQWSGNQWSDGEWSGAVWDGNQWSGNQWSGNQWSGNQWSGNQWSGNQWSAAQWTGFLSATWG